MGELFGFAPESADFFILKISSIQLAVDMRRWVICPGSLCNNHPRTAPTRHLKP